ncbi:peptide-methionine (S)-S-oxide reductase MsrA [Candidatus Woesearchaeota archaeon]|nr:peptide-methionine (S)-S-oxide reductase MsrA [Candidatus Woesearchaeota archaeon]
MKTEKATFAMGCFWHPQRVFDKIKGVINTEAGFMGGDESFTNLSYNQVCTGTTRHAEVVQMTFNPEIISYEKLLEIFWKEHDPTTIDRQGPDIGDQYRSIIFYHNEKQKELASKSKNEKQKGFKNKIVTEIKKAGKFYKAEEYHQHYFKKKSRFDNIF